MEHVQSVVPHAGVWKVHQVSRVWGGVECTCVCGCGCV